LNLAELSHRKKYPVSNIGFYIGILAFSNVKFPMLDS